MSLYVQLFIAVFCWEKLSVMPLQNKSQNYFDMKSVGKRKKNKVSVLSAACRHNVTVINKLYEGRKIVLHRRLELLFHCWIKKKHKQISGEGLSNEDSSWRRPK